MNRFKFSAGAAVMAAALLVSPVAHAAGTWDFPLIGTMKLPQHIIFERGVQEALPFRKDGRGTEWYFVHHGLKNGNYYTMTYSNPPDFTYGWAMSSELGPSFLFEEGLTAYKDASPVDQMDAIADSLNKKLKTQLVTYTGDAPLNIVKDKKNHHWEGSFVTTTKENGITYKEAYDVILKPTDYSVVVGVIASDAQQQDVTASIQKMVKERKPLKEQNKMFWYLKK